MIRGNRNAPFSATAVLRPSEFQLSRRRLIGAAGAGLGLTLAARLGVRAQDAVATGEITVYSGRSENLVSPVLEKFQQESGITVKTRYGDTAEMAATILEEGDNSPADLFFAQDAGALGAVEAEGRFTQLPTNLLDLVDAKYRSAEGRWIGTTGRARVAVYNTEQLTDDAIPASVEDLTSEEWKDKVGWAPTNGSFQSFVTAFRVLKGEDAARAWLEAMRDNGAITFESNGPIASAVGAGEIPLGLVNHYYMYEIQAEEGKTLPLANHYFAAGDVGSLVNVAGVGVLNSAANPDGALALVDYLLSTDAQIYFATSTWEYPLIEGVPAFPDLIPLDQIQSPDIELGDLSDLQGTLALLTEVGII
jgi:iron(III) transport system substrate-binding protein